MKLRTTISALCACIALTGCNAIFETIATQPGNALADKQAGTVQLATATQESLTRMFPIGTDKAAIIQALGEPQTTTNSSDGASQQFYSYTFTSHRQKLIASRTAAMEYDKASKLTKLTLTVMDTPIQ
ncbi:hypothetical protein [Paralcaligenes ureilyticus]|uniref:Beta-barrel assembly machine subunit BamE n=1 Tax=Paralcaligenes ureilyticus TaxID=627131 RepID=A0A4R3LUR3_9BURK|nr:hypothetical protein [Paralcaligenes ureilyticus]TCT03766.1 hypothetical protein EDC26_11474 [Paralcaligenes ureilyticus]